MTPSREEIRKLYYAQLQRVLNTERTLHREHIALQKIMKLMETYKPTDKFIK